MTKYHRDTLPLLEAARWLISDKRSWTQHASARDVSGAECYEGSGEAVCWCASGALVATYLAALYSNVVVDSIARHEADRELDRAAQPARRLPYANIYVEHNDTRSHKTVLEMFDRAIARVAEAA